MLLSRDIKKREDQRDKIKTHSTNQSVIKTAAIYAPTDNLPSFWNTVHETMGDNPNKLIMGDYNVTLDHNLDAYGYKTDPHHKSRKAINNWLDN